MIFGVDAESRAAAVAFAIDHNNLSLLGGTLGFIDLLGLWDEEALQTVLRSLPDAGQLLASFDGDEVDALIAPDFDPVPADDQSRLDRKKQVSCRSVDMSFRLDFCLQAAARHATSRWHYSRSMPASKLVRIGVWEDEVFRGAILYGVGANRHIGLLESSYLIASFLLSDSQFPSSPRMMWSRSRTPIKSAASVMRLVKAMSGTLGIGFPLG